MDHPVGMKIHRVSTPLMGGLAVYAAFAVTAILSLPLSKPVVGVLVGGGVAIAVGICDEFLTLPPRAHFVGQVAAAGSALLAGIGVISNVSLPFTSLTSRGWQLPLAVGLPLTIIWIVGMINTVNFLDGLDGLASGVSAIAALFLAAWAWEESNRFYVPVAPHHEDLLLPLALAGALAGFLPYNWRPAKIFLGDSGSMFLGVALASLAIVGPAKLGTALLLLLIPVLDVAWAIVRRRMRGKSFLTGDKQHVYHRMLDLNVGYTSTVLLLYGICIALGVLDLLLVKQWKLLAFVLLAAATTALFVYLEIRASHAAGAQGHAGVRQAAETPE